MTDEEQEGPAGSVTASGSGYGMVAADGGIVTIGDHPFRGSMGATTLHRLVVGMVALSTGDLMVASPGGIFDFLDEPFLGSLGADPPPWPIVSVASSCWRRARRRSAARRRSGC